MAKAVPAHEAHAILQIFIGADGHGIIGHDLSHAGGTGIAAFSDHPPHEVPFGENSDQLSIVDDGNGTNVALDHGTHGLQNRVAKFGLIGILIFD
jgi:hypothetical protein